MASVNEITPKQLMRLIGTPSAPQIVDVCIDDDFAQDPRLIPTSFRKPHTEMAALVARRKGKKMSQGVAAYLRSEGIAAEYLQGGIFGWRDAAMPLILAGRPARAHRWCV